MRGCFAVAFVLAPLVVGAIGLTAAERDRQTLARMQPVEAEILGTSVGERRRTRADRRWEVFYSPRAHFAYHVEGERYTSRRYALRTSEYVTRASAERRLAPYSAGATATAYYDPRAPEVAVLNRGVGALPYLGILIGAGMFAAAPLAWTKENRKAPPPPPRREGRYYRLEAPVTQRARLRGGLLSVGLWAAFTAAVAAYFFQGPSGFVPMGVYEILGFLIYGGIGLAGGHQAWTAHQRGKAYDDAVIWLTRDHLVIGADNPVLYEQTMRRSDTVREVRVGATLFEVTATIRADGKRIPERSAAHEVQIVLGENVPVWPGGRLRLEGRIPIAPGLPPARLEDTLVYPRKEWAIEVRLETEEGGVYEALLPVSAEEAATAGGAPHARLR